MDSYYKRPTPGHLGNVAAYLRPAGEAGTVLRRLLPYPGAAETLPTVAMTALSPGGTRAQDGAASSVLAPVDSRAAASIVSEAASILDDEMAKGVLAARATSPGARYAAPDRSSPLLRQLHDLVDNLAGIWPTLQGTSGFLPAPILPSSSGGVASGPLPELEPRSSVRPGERAIIQMILCNKEERAVRLVPVATDLLGNTGVRIASHLLQFASSEIRLGPGEQEELEIAATVPGEALPGCYSGLLVVTGVEYLRALITIEVA